ncbi:MAG: NUDIX domain-containing protein [Candidatus Pacearchaeota archaeon]|jgi:dATP pyrophosphohydrolase
MPKYRKAVFALPYAKTKDGIEYILLKRRLHWIGWEFTKGGIEKGETKEQTARRELMEETGRKAIKIKKFNYSGKYRYNKKFPTRIGMVGQTFTLFAAEVKKGLVTISRKEHSRHKWVSYSQAMKMLKFADQRKSLRIVNSWLMHGRKN